MNHFDLFSLPHSYSLDLKLLDKQYFALQVKHHPDRAQDDAQKTEFVKASTQINETYKALKNDYARASHLLKLQNIDIENESTNYPLSPEILQQIWEDREELEEAQDIPIFLAHKIEDRKKLLIDLSNAFNIANYEKAAILTLMLKYLDNLMVAAKEKLA